MSSFGNVVKYRIPCIWAWIELSARHPPMAQSIEQMHWWHSWYLRLFPSTYYYPNDYNSELLYIQKLYSIVNKQIEIDGERGRDFPWKTIQSNRHRYSSCWTFSLNSKRIWIQQNCQDNWNVRKKCVSVWMFDLDCLMTVNAWTENRNRWND